MKENRTVETTRLVANLEIILSNNNEKMIAFTSDTPKADVTGLVGELADIFRVKHKVAIFTYEPIDNAIEGIDNVVIDGVNDSAESINAKAEPYDVVLVICPNMNESMMYLRMAEYVHELVVVAKKWKSKTASIVAINELATNAGINVLGVVYEK